MQYYTLPDRMIVLESNSFVVSSSAVVRDDD